MEKKRRGIEERLKKMSDSPKDDVVTFEQLGIDRLFVDESLRKEVYREREMGQGDA